MDCDVPTVAGSDLRVVAFTARPGTEDADKLRLLATRRMTEPSQAWGACVFTSVMLSPQPLARPFLVGHALCIVHRVSPRMGLIAKFAALGSLRLMPPPQPSEEPEPQISSHESEPASLCPGAWVPACQLAWFRPDLWPRLYGASG